MTETELIIYMRKCQRENLDSNIVIPDKKSLISAASLIINTSNSAIKICILFDENGKNSPLFELLNTELFTKNLIDFLSETSTQLFIGSNKTKTIRASNLINEIFKKPDLKSKVKIHTIPSNIYSLLKKNHTTNEYIISYPNAVLFGGFTLSDDSFTFINFNEKSFSETLSGFFDTITRRTTQTTNMAIGEK